MRVPAAREVAEEPLRAGEVAALHDEAAHHPRELADLDVLEAKLARQALRRGFPGRRLLEGSEELARGRRRKEMALLVRHVAAQRVIEFRDGLARGVERSRPGRREKPAEDAVQRTVLGAQIEVDVRHPSGF